MANILDNLINEIAILTGLSPEEVKTNFTQEQLDNLLQSSQCEETSSGSPVVSSLDDVSCKDDGAPSDLVNTLKKLGNFPKGLKDAQKPSTVIEQPEPPFDGTECAEAVKEVNEEIKQKVEIHTEHSILLNKLYELKDNIQPLEFYYIERNKHLTKILNDFEPVLKEIKRLKKLISNYTLTKIPEAVSNRFYYDSLLLAYPNNTSYKDLSNLWTSREIRYKNELSNFKTELNNQKLIRDRKTANYPLINDTILNGFNFESNSSSIFISQVESTITASTANYIKSKLRAYSEYIETEIKTTGTTLNSIISNPIIRFKIKLQDLNYMSIDKEKFDLQTGNKSVYKKRYLIKDNPLLNSKSYFKSVPGYTIKNVKSKEESKGFLYTSFYNLLDDPINNFFTTQERGLTSEVNQVDPNLKGSNATTKNENGKKYYIKDMKTMENFYKNFNDTWEIKKQQVRKKTVDLGLSKVKSALERVAKADIELLLSVGRVNLDLPEDSRRLRTIIDKTKEAGEKFVKILSDLDDEILRLEDLVNGDGKISPSLVKKMLKEKNSKCFSKLQEDTDPCPDVKSKLGSDVFFESLDGIDPTLPNFSQGCYWKEFAKLANIQGLLPIPNSPIELRYWPVGLIIPTPATLVKIPLPQIWIPLVTISTPLGVLVTFLNINGTFISPVVFFVSASGFKQHMISVRGSSTKFGYDKDEENIKSSIMIPLSVQSKIDLAKSGNLNIDKNLTDEEAAKLEILKQKKAEAEAENDPIRTHKANKEIDSINQQVSNRITPDSQKMNSVISKGETASEEVQNIKKSIYKVMDTVGKPSIDEINKLKERATERESKLKEEKVKALEAGDTSRVKEINEELKTDGLSIDEKKEAYKKDMNSYLDSIVFPTTVLPKELDKLNPKPDSGADIQNDRVTEMSSTLQTEFISDGATKVSNMFSLNIAKHKEELESNIPSGTLNVDSDTDKIKEHMNNMIDTVKDRATGAGSTPVDPSSASSQLSSARDKVDNAKTEDERKKAQEEYNNAQKNFSKKLEQDRIKQTLAFSISNVNLLAGVKVDIDPFAECCPKEEFKTEFLIPGELSLILDQGVNLIKASINDMSTDSIKQMMGGKKNVNAKDIRLGLLNIIKSSVPSSLSIPKPEINLKTGVNLFKGLITGLSLPQASFPKILADQQLDSKIKIDTTIVKQTIKTALNSYLDSKLLVDNAQNLENAFIHTNPNDVKSFMKQFIDSMTDSIESALSAYYVLLNSKKPANGLSLNILEETTFKILPFGKLAEAIFIAKGQFKMSQSKADSTYVMNTDVIETASKTIKTLLSPIVSNPTAYIIAASAGVSNTADQLRELHPILSADDIPPWERLSLKNILFLIFLDEFISVGADQVGYFRQYL